MVWMVPNKALLTSSFLLPLPCNQIKLNQIKIFIVVIDQHTPRHGHMDQEKFNQNWVASKLKTYNFKTRDVRPALVL